MTKKRSKLFIALLVFLVLSVGQVGHTQLVVQKAEVVTAPSLAGRVVVGLMNIPGKGAIVELRTTGWKAVIAATKADENGNFSLPTPPAKLYFLYVSLPGTNPYELTVRIKKHSAHSLEIHLIVAT